jgi:hypothetical protein
MKIFMLIMAAAIIAAYCASCGGGGGGTASSTTTTTPGTQPTGIPGAPLLNTVLLPYASTTATLPTLWSVDGNCSDFYSSGVQKAGPNNTNTTISITNALLEGNNSFSATCKNSAGTSGPSTSYGIILDTTAPGAPTLATALSTTTNAASVTISITVSYDWLIESRVNNGAWTVVLQRMPDFTDTNYDTKITRDYTQSLVNGLNTINIRATDRAGNVGSSYLPLTITSSATGGGTTTNPAAPTISCSHSTNGLTLTSTFTITGSGCTSATMYWGNDPSGNSNTNITCSGGVFSKTFSGAGTYNTVATVNSAGGSNTCSQSITVASSGGGAGTGFYNSYASWWSGGYNDIAQDGNVTYAVKDTSNPSGGCVYRRTESGGTMSACTSLTNMSFSFQTPVSIAACKNDDDKIGVFDTDISRIVIVRFSITGATYLSYISITGGKDSKLDCDKDGNWLLADPSAGTVKKLSPTGSLQWTYTTGLSNPADVASDSGGNVFIANEGGDNVIRLTPAGVLNTSWGQSGSTAVNEFTSIIGIAVNESDVVFVLDGGQHVIKAFSNSGSPLGQFGSNGTGDGQFDTPVAVTASGSGISSRVCVADNGATVLKIKEFHPAP